MGWEHCQTVDPLKESPELVRILFVVHLLILDFKFQFLQIHQSSTIDIFPNLTNPLRKISFPKCPQITQKFTQNRQTVVKEISIQI